MKPALTIPISASCSSLEWTTSLQQPILWLEISLWINVFWFPPCYDSSRFFSHISSLMIVSQTVHHTDVISRSQMSQYGGHVACMIISNPLCSGSGLATDPCWPPRNWFCAWTQSRRKLSQDISGESRKEEEERESEWEREREEETGKH